MNEPTPKSEAAKTMLAHTSLPEEPTAAKSLPVEEHGRETIRKYMVSMARNQKANFKKNQRMEHKSIQLYHYINGRDKAIWEAFSRIIPGDMPTLPLFPNSMFARDCSLPPTPLSSNANEPFTPVLKESESKETQNKLASPVHATPVDFANTQDSYSENTYVEDSNKPVESSFVVQISEDAKLEEVDKDIGNDFASFMQDIKNFLQGNFLGGWAFTDEKEEPTDLEEKAIDDDAEQALVKDVLDDTTKENGEDVVDASEFVDGDPVRFDAETLLTRSLGAKQVGRKKS
ncbi:hypothetical protein V6N11_058589 [Hibiscus sabdariffa]|uniref:Uncharacterized protein n=1 Tax=Hibiscus sabdariffa TaxID=183260 RepID=A0ABR2U4U0_9ROSI